MNNVNNANNAHNACRKCNRTKSNTIENRQREKRGRGTPWHWLCHKVHKLQQRQQQLCLSFPYACRTKISWPPRQIGITANRQIALIFALRSGKLRSFFCLANCFIMCVPSFLMIFTWESHSQMHHSYAALDAQTNVTFVTCVRRFFWLP